MSHQCADTSIMSAAGTPSSSVRGVVDAWVWLVCAGLVGCDHALEVDHEAGVGQRLERWRLGAVGEHTHASSVLAEQHNRLEAVSERGHMGHLFDKAVEHARIRLDLGPLQSVLQASADIADERSVRIADRVEHCLDDRIVERRQYERLAIADRDRRADRPWVEQRAVEVEQNPARAAHGRGWGVRHQSSISDQRP